MNQLKIQKERSSVTTQRNKAVHFFKSIELMFTPPSQIIYAYAISFASLEFVSSQSMINCVWLSCEKSSRERYFSSEKICRWLMVGLYWNRFSGVQPEKLRGRGRWVFRCCHGWLRISALGQCYNAQPVTLPLNFILSNSRIGFKCGVFCKYSVGQCMPKDVHEPFFLGLKIQ